MSFWFRISIFFNKCFNHRKKKTQARFERGLGREIDHLSTKVYKYASQFADPRSCTERIGKMDASNYKDLMGNKILKCLGILVKREFDWI